MIRRFSLRTHGHRLRSASQFLARRRPRFGRRQIRRVTVTTLMIPPLLNGARCVLRPVTEADLDPLLTWYNSKDIFKFMGRETPLTMDDQHAWLATTRSDPSVSVWAVQTRDDASLVGSITLRNLTDRARRAELGIITGISGRGFGSDAIQTVLAFAFQTLNIQCVSLEVRGDNRRAITAYMHAGFRPEGILRRRLLKGGILHDLYSMSMLREEFEAEPL